MTGIRTVAASRRSVAGEGGGYHLGRGRLLTSSKVGTQADHTWFELNRTVRCEIAAVGRS
jgi:hypothetical protein